MYGAQKYLIGCLMFFSSISFAAEPFTITQNHICGDTKIIIENLQNKFKEQPAIISMGEDGSSISIWVSPETKTMTILKSSAEQGLSCIFGTGEQTKILDIPVGDKI